MSDADVLDTFGTSAVSTQPTTNESQNPDDVEIESDGATVFSGSTLREETSALEELSASENDESDLLATGNNAGASNAHTHQIPEEHFEQEHHSSSPDYVLADYSPPQEDPPTDRDFTNDNDVASTALNNYFSAPNAAQDFEDEQQLPQSLPFLSSDDEDEGSGVLLEEKVEDIGQQSVPASAEILNAPITPHEDYFPSPINSAEPPRRQSSKHPSLSDGDLSPYEHVDLVERLSLSSDPTASVPLPTTGLDEDVNSHEYPRPVRKDSSDFLNLAPSIPAPQATPIKRSLSVELSSSPGEVIQVAEDITSPMNNNNSYSSETPRAENASPISYKRDIDTDDDSVGKSIRQSASNDDQPGQSNKAGGDTKRAPARAAPSRQAPGARRAAAAAAANVVVVTQPPPPVVDLRSREESLPPPPPPVDDDESNIPTYSKYRPSILPPPDDPPEEDPPAISNDNNIAQPVVDTNFPPGYIDADMPVLERKPPPPERKVAPPPPPSDKKGPPPPPPSVLVKVSAPSGRRREGIILGPEDFQKPPEFSHLGVAPETRRRNSTGGSEGDEPPPPPRVPGPKPPPRPNKGLTGPGDTSTPTRQDLEHAMKDPPMTPSNVRPGLERGFSAMLSPSMRGVELEDGPSFANSLPHNFEVVSNQVGVGIRQTKSITVLLKSIIDIQREASQKIMALIEKEQRKQFMDSEDTTANESGAGRLLAAVTRDSIINPRGRDGMDRFAKVYDKTIGFLAQEAADQLQHIAVLEREVVNPLLNHNQNNNGRLNALAQTERTCRESMTEMSKQVKKAQENCDKLLEQAIQARAKDAAAATSPSTPSPAAKPSTLRSKVNQVSHKISTGRLREAQKAAVTAAEAYEQAVNEANMRQKQFHSQDLPSLFNQLEALERTRLNDVSKILAKLIESKIAANEPRAQSCNRLMLDSKELDARKDMMDFLQRWIERSGAPPPPVPFSYQCQCTPSDIARGRFENTSSYFRDTLTNVMIKQQPTFPEEKVPHLVEVCIKALTDNGGFQSEGIFRISIPKEELEAIIKQIDGGDLNVFANNSNPNAPAALLKQWLRLLDEPVIPHDKYAQAVHLGSEATKGDTSEAMVQFFKELPQVNQDLLRRITHGLVAEIVKPENVEKNRMSVRNLAIVFSPGFLRNMSDDPMDMLNSQRFEQTFTTKLFECLLREKHSS